ncbi:MAG: cytochrome P460 family protein [Luteimonas sp.]|nr:cytochrome P460 family protein [Luteimonas sp.]
MQSTRAGVLAAVAVAASCALVVGLAAGAGTGTGAQSKPASPIYGVTVPDGYRQWQLIAPAREAEPLDELRAVLGNTVAVDAYRKGTLPFPDGTVLAKLAWKHVQSPEFEPASIPGAATTLQFMVKDSKRYATTGGWGFGRFIDGKPADEAQHRTCFACHQTRVINHDFVFTRLAP